MKKTNCEQGYPFTCKLWILSLKAYPSRMIRPFWCIPFHTRKSVLPPCSHISRRIRMYPNCQSIHPYLPCKSERFSSLASMQNWLRHQHGGRFIVLGRQYGCPDSLSQNSQNLTVVTDFFKTNWRDLWVGQKHSRGKAVSLLLCSKTILSSNVSSAAKKQEFFFKFIPRYVIFLTTAPAY